MNKYCLCVCDFTIGENSIEMCVFSEVFQINVSENVTEMKIDRFTRACKFYGFTYVTLYKIVNGSGNN